MKKGIMLTAGILLLALITLGSCKKEHEHAYTGSWVKDADYHWHECDGEECSEIADKAAHSGGTATETEKAICSVCGQSYGELLVKPDNPIPEHQHSLSLIDKVEANIFKNGTIEHYQCSSCGKLYKDSEGKEEITDISCSLWAPLADIGEPESSITDDVSVSFSGTNASAYISNIFVDNEGNEIVGPLNEKTSNNEFTLDVDFVANGTFDMVLFAGENTKSVYTDDSIQDGIADKLGFYIRFDKDDESNNIKLLAALGNGDLDANRPARAGISGMGYVPELSFDGETTNNLKVEIERYSVDKTIVHIYVNNELLVVNLVDVTQVDILGFNLRTAWDRHNFTDGIGKSNNKVADAYSHIALSRGLSEEVGYADGLAIVPSSEATVTLTKVALTKTAEKFTGYNAEVAAEEFLKSAADCDSKAVYYKSCECCGRAGTETFEYGEVLGHVFGEWETKTPATCTEKEIEHRVCLVSACEYEEVRDGDAALNHHLVDNHSATQHWKECDRENCNYEEGRENHYGGTATEDDRPVCSGCGNAYGSALEHTCLFDQRVTDSLYLASSGDCQHNAVYYLSCECGEKGTETFDSDILGDHIVEKVNAVSPSIFKNGTIEHYGCTICGAAFSDEAAQNPISNITSSIWKKLSDVVESTMVSTNDTSVSFEGTNSAAYIENIFVDESGDEIVGALNANTANNEYTLDIDFVANGTFDIILFAHEDTPVVYKSDAIVNNVAPKFGFYIRLDSEDAEANVKLQAALGNGTSSRKAMTGYTAKGKANVLVLDGQTLNNIKVQIERYSDTKAIVHIYVNDQLVEFVMIQKKQVDFTGFNFRTAWDRHNIVDDGGLGDSYYDVSKTYAHIALSRGLSAEAGFEKGLAIAPSANAKITLSKVEFTKTKHKCTFNLEVAEEAHLKSAADCDSKAVYYKSCECGEHYKETFEYGEPAGHTYGEWETKSPATCLEKEVEHHLCKDCGNEETRDGDAALGHDMKVAHEGDYHWYECAREGCIEKTVKEGHIGGTATDTDLAKCEICGQEYGSLVTHEHVYNQQIIDEKYLVEGSDCQHTASYYKSCECGEKGTETFESDTLGAHNMTKVEEREASAFHNGNIEHYYCEVCEKYFADEKGMEEVSDVSNESAWKSLADVESHTGPVVNGTSATFEGIGSSSYIANILVDSNGNEIAGIYNAEVANKEHTLTMDIVANGTFVVILFANENSENTYADDDIVDKVAKKLGFYITFDSSKSDIAIKSPLGNGTSSEGATTGNKARGGTNLFKFDGTTVNTVSITLERVDETNLVLTVSINGELVSFTKTNTANHNVCGFALLKSWDGTTMGDESTSKTKAYAPLGIRSGMSATEGLGNGIAVAPVDAKGVETSTKVVLSNISVTNTEAA